MRGAEEPNSHHEVHDRTKSVKAGTQRLDKRSAQGVSGQPKKSGQGGKYTWGGSLAEEEDDPVAVLDKNDPNYVDEEEAEKVAPGGAAEETPSGAPDMPSGTSTDNQGKVKV